MSKFYVISIEDIGPNAEPLNEEIVIQTVPGRTNQSNEERIEGWLGTTNDIHYEAHGEYDSLESAIKFIKSKWPGFSEIETDENDESEIRRFKDIREVWTVDDWLNDWKKSNIEAETTNNQIEKFMLEIENEADEQNIYIDGSIIDYLTEYRDSLRITEKFTTYLYSDQIKRLKQMALNRGKGVTAAEILRELLD